MKPRLIPQPKEIVYTGGVSKIGRDMPVEETLDPAMGPKAYTLTLKDSRVAIAAGSEAGAFYARQTLAQIFATCGRVCDELVIRDAPLHDYRGFMVDCCRHFYGVEELKTLIEAAAYFKLNRFHWHLTDDQGWRIAIEQYPLLTEVGGKRPDSLFGGFREGVPHEGWFTPDEIREVVSFCAARHIEVVPEIDMPGHFTAAIAAYPFLGCTGQPVSPEMKQGIFPNVLCIGNDEAVDLVKNVLSEVCALFPGKYVHIGGDEAPRTHWMNCKACRAKMRALGISDYDAFQGWFIREIAQFLKTKGKTAITWNESLKGGMLEPGDAVVQRWLEKEPLSREFATAGGNLIESDFYHYYFDYPYGMTPLKKTYAYDPCKKAGDPNAVFGLEGTLWTEYVRSFPDLCQKLFPRITVVAERSWHGYPGRDYAAFAADLRALVPSLRDFGISLPPEAQWNPPAPKRLGEVVRFFKGTLSIDLLKQALFPEKGEAQDP